MLERRQDPYILCVSICVSVFEMDIVKPKTPRSINCISIHKDQANPNSKGKKSKGGCVTGDLHIILREECEVRIRLHLMTPFYVDKPGTPRSCPSPSQVELVDVHGVSILF